MAAYNRRWYILSAIIGALGIGLIGASFGTEELVTMELNSDSANAGDQCLDFTSTRKLGLFTGTDRLCSILDITTYQHWPVTCLGHDELCGVTNPTEEYFNTVPRMCECDDDNKMMPTYQSSLHWAIFSMLLIGALIACYGTAIAFYNGITKPTQEIFGVRAVLVSLLTAMVLNLVGMVLTIVYFYGSYKVDFCSMLTDSINVQIPSVEQQYTCDNVNLGLSFYFQLISLVCFGLSIGAAFMGQHGFQSIDETSKIDQTKTKDVGVESSMIF